MTLPDHIGLPVVNIGSNPAAGAEISETVGNNIIEELESMIITLVTDATAANRRVRILLDDGTTVFYQHEAQAVQAASLTRDYVYGAGLGFEEAAFALAILAIGIPKFIIATGYRIRTSTVNLQAGDDYAAMEWKTNRWIRE